MKRVLTSASLLALGAVSIYGLDPEMTRQQSGSPFTISGTVRGFYDDNINTSSDGFEQESFGYQLSPAVHLNLPFEQTFLSLGYIYTYSWYEERDPRNYDQTHEFNARFRHAFSPRQSIGVKNAFIYTSEPTVVDSATGIITAPTRTVIAGRTKSNVYHNYGVIDYNLGLTRTMSLALGYANNWYDYEADGVGSRSALLDRLEHNFWGDLRRQFTPKVVGLVGYSLGLVQFTGDEVIGFEPGGAPLESDVRDSISHRAYVGGTYDITAKMTASARVGVQYTDYDDLNESSFSPYADISVSYTLRPGTAIEVGVLHSRSATDISSVDGEGRPTTDAETTALFAQFTHRITRELSGSLLGQYQHSTFEFGRNDGDTEDLWLFGANLTYTFNRHWSAEVGYNFDLLDSNLTTGDRDYDRNRVYIGVTARY